MYQRVPQACGGKHVLCIMLKFSDGEDGKIRNMQIRMTNKMCKCVFLLPLTVSCDCFIL